MNQKDLKVFFIDDFRQEIRTRTASSHRAGQGSFLPPKSYRQNSAPKKDKSHDNLPGEGIKNGETIEQTLRRKALEELDISIQQWTPLEYQRVYDNNNNESFQPRVYAKLKKERNSMKDPDGSVIGYELVPIEKLNEHINYGDMGELFIKKTKSGIERNHNTTITLKIRPKRVLF